MRGLRTLIGECVVPIAFGFRVLNYSPLQGNVHPSHRQHVLQKAQKAKINRSNRDTSMHPHTGHILLNATGVSTTM
jgi:hypothetical protein